MSVARSNMSCSLQPPRLEQRAVHDSLVSLTCQQPTGGGGESGDGSGGGDGSPGGGDGDVAAAKRHTQYHVDEVAVPHALTESRGLKYRAEPVEVTMQPGGTCGLSYSRFHVHEMESSTPAAVHSARLEEMSTPPAEAHVPDCTIWYEYVSGPDGGGGGGGGDGST
jgi:hypothetical protein